MGVIIFFGFPLIVLGIAAGLGFGSAMYFSGRFAHDQEQAAGIGIGLAVGIVVIASLSYALTGSKEFVKIYGNLMEYMWACTLVAFTVGVIFGYGLRKNP